MASSLASAGASVVLVSKLYCWAMNQGNSGGCFSCKEQIGVGGCPGAINSSKTYRFPSAEPQHIE